MNTNVSVAKSGDLVRKKKKGHKNSLNLYPRETKFLKALLSGSRPVEAAQKAYNVTSLNSAQNMATVVTKRERFQKVLEQRGFTDGAMAATFTDGLMATRPIIVKGTIKDYPDFATRHQFLKTGLVVKGYYRHQDSEEGGEKEPLVVKSVQFIKNTVNVGQTNDKDS